MNKKEIIVPKGIRYLSDWKEFNFGLFPSKCILDKVVPGCGFTEYCITGRENVILCSPRKMLLQNKYDQHEGEVYLVKNELEIEVNIDKNLEKPDKSRYILQNPTDEEKKRVYNRIYTELEYFIRMNDIYSKPNKILVTYDSYHIVKDILTSMGVFDKYYTIIDEFQSILHDSKFKSDTEINFLDNLQDSPTSIFVSATPMMEEYLDLLDEFKDLPYLLFNWIVEEPGRVVNPDINPFTMKSVGTKAAEIIKKYKEGNFEKINRINKDTGEIEEIISTEAVFYVNSVNHIINIIKTCNLQPEEINILCSNTSYNKSRIKSRLKNKYMIGKVPKKGEINKMFTFCTRTVYLGADFYSKCARSFIFSDANIDTLVVDISEDLTQILGRQRDLDNPWKNIANFYVKTDKNFHDTDEKEFRRRLDEKISVTKNLLKAYEESAEEVKKDLSNAYKKIAKMENYKDNYVAVNSTGIPVFNKWVILSERRAFDIQKYDYKDFISLFGRIEQRFNVDLSLNKEEGEVINKYQQLRTKKEKIIYLCELSKEMQSKILNKEEISGKIQQYFSILGPSRIKSLGYNTTKLDLEIENLKLLQGIKDKVQSSFIIGESYLNSISKQKLQEIYDEAGIKQTAKAVDLDRWFELKKQKMRDINTDKRIDGFKLIKKL